MVKKFNQPINVVLPDKLQTIGFPRHYCQPIDKIKFPLSFKNIEFDPADDDKKQIDYSKYNMVDKYNNEDSYCEPYDDNEYDADDDVLHSHQLSLAAIYNVDDNLNDDERESGYKWILEDIINKNHKKIITIQYKILEKKREFDMKHITRIQR